MHTHTHINKIKIFSLKTAIKLNHNHITSFKNILFKNKTINFILFFSLMLSCSLKE